MATSDTDSFFAALRSQHSPSRSPESLELMGKQAAARFLNEGMKLNDAVKQVISEEGDVSQEHIKRVVEFANTSAYLGIHDRNKTAGANSSYPQFELADPGRIIQEMSDGSKPVTVIPNDVDYGRAPPKSREKTAGVRGRPADLVVRDEAGFFDELNTHWKTEKTASDVTVKQVIGDVYKQKQDLEALEGVLTDKGYSLEREKVALDQDYLSVIKDHLREGGSFRDVVVAARAVAEHEKVANVLVETIVTLAKEKVASFGDLRASLAGLEKVAHRIVDTDHPFVTMFAGKLALEEALEKIAVSLDEVQKAKAEIQSFLKETIDAPKAPEARWTL